MITVVMHEKAIKVLDFDEAVELARTDPEAFEQYRRDIISILIDRAPERNRHQLRCLQWRIDQERKRASNPIDACLKLYRMMWDSFVGDSGLIDTIRNAGKSRHGVQSPLPKAKGLSFSRETATENPSEF